jgi:hypothetical protein
VQLAEIMSKYKDRTYLNTLTLFSSSTTIRLWSFISQHYSRHAMVVNTVPSKPLTKRIPDSFRHRIKVSRQLSIGEERYSEGRITDKLKRA